MPDLRDDLGRLADFVGEPGSFRALEEARRRRERRRRASGLVVGLGVFVAAAVALAATLRSGPVATPADTPSGTDGPPAIPLVWPENPVNGSSVEDVQSAVDAGDQSVLWRTDPGEVVGHFGKQILGRSMRIVETSRSADDTTTVRAFPCPPGEEPGAVSCDVLDGDPISFTLVQPATQGEGGVWSIVEVQSPPLTIPEATELPMEVAVGQKVGFHVAQLSSSTAAHLGIVVSNGCHSTVWSVDITAEGDHSVIVPKLEQADPACSTSVSGFLYAYATDDTTLPSADPINEPTAIEYPWITIVPIWISPEGGNSDDPSPPAGESASSPSSEPADSAVPTDVAVACDGESTLVQGSGTVAAQADGVHLTVSNQGSADTEFNIADGVKNVDLAPGESVDLVQSLDPGDHFVLCDVEGGSFTENIDVVDPDGYWFDQDPDCSADQSKGADIDSGPLGVEGDPGDEIMSAAGSIFESNIAGSALEGGYELRTGAYPDQSGYRTIVAVDAEGHVVGAVWFREHDADWSPTNYATCDANATF